MSDLAQRLFEESQDDTESLYWKAWSEIDQLRQQFEQAQEENESFREKLYVSEARIAELEAARATGEEALGLYKALEDLHRDSLSSFDYRGSPREKQVEAALATTSPTNQES